MGLLESVAKQRELAGHAKKCIVCDWGATLPEEEQKALAVVSQQVKDGVAEAAFTHRALEDEGFLGSYHSWRRHTDRCL